MRGCVTVRKAETRAASRQNTALFITFIQREEKKNLRRVLTDFLRCKRKGSWVPIRI